MARVVVAGLISAALVGIPGGANEQGHVAKQWQTMERIRELRDPRVAVRFTTDRLFVIDLRRQCAAAATGSFTMPPLCRP
jgi:hypothetical protein